MDLVIRKAQTRRGFTTFMLNIEALVSLKLSNKLGEG